MRVSLCAIAVIGQASQKFYAIRGLSRRYSARVATLPRWSHLGGIAGGTGFALRPTLSIMDPMFGTQDRFGPHERRGASLVMEARKTASEMTASPKAASQRPRHRAGAASHASVACRGY